MRNHLFVDNTEMKMDFNLNVLTLNCWGLVGVSRNRRERMAGIAAHIASSKYDFVFLQEVWSKEDFQMIRKKASAVLPYSHYFHSGVVGSGVCILSRSVIVDVAQFRFSLNGFAHKILHGDWFAGKSVGLCKVIHHGLKINLYVTHLHANYDFTHDQYLSHRIVQAFELSQFVKTTSESCDLCIVAGDLNTESHEIPYQLILHNVGVSDSLMTAQSLKDREVNCATCGHPDNPYTSRSERHECPTGKRIDYILYKCGKDVSVKCLSCESPLQKIPDTNLPYSDHEAVVSQLQVCKCSANDSTCERNPKDILEALNGGQNILSKSMHDLTISRLFYFALGFISLVIIVLTAVLKLPPAYQAIVEILQVATTIILAFSVWMCIIMHKVELNSLLECLNAMQILMNAYSEYDVESLNSNPKTPEPPY